MCNRSPSFFRWRLVQELARIERNHCVPLLVLFGWKVREWSGYTKRNIPLRSWIIPLKKIHRTPALVSSPHNASLLVALEVSLLSCSRPQSLRFQLPPPAGGGQPSLSLSLCCASCPGADPLSPNRAGGRHRPIGASRACGRASHIPLSYLIQRVEEIWL
jgi:hypothetical protein